MGTCVCVFLYTTEPLIGPPIHSINIEEEEEEAYLAL